MSDGALPPTARRILVAVGMGPETGAIRAALELARCTHASLAFVHVLDLSRVTRAALSGDLEAVKVLRAEAEARLRAIGPSHGHRRPFEVFVSVGAVAPEIVRVATSWDADLLVVSTGARPSRDGRSAAAV
ncbi:MAG: universal stress protein [Labilithrix sp.]|nr:universal stress protein [Labilithrix sp.]MCW5817419.1 universal stress protein [Labilithrix sp.]